MTFMTLIRHEGERWLIHDCLLVELGLIARDAFGWTRAFSPQEDTNDECRAIKSSQDSADVKAIKAFWNNDRWSHEANTYANILLMNR